MKQSKFVGHLGAAVAAISLTATAAYAATPSAKISSHSTDATLPAIDSTHAKPQLDSSPNRPLKTVGLILHLKRGSEGTPSDIEMTLADRQSGFYKSEEVTPYVSGYCSPKSGSSTASGFDGCDHDGAEVSTLRTGVRIEATPTVGANGSVILELQVTDEQLDAVTNFKTPAGNLQQPLAHGNHFAGTVALHAGVPTIITEQTSKGETWEVTAVIDPKDAANPTEQ
ncbi:hypothetical protein A8H39_01415 [Paraburkholderia fungorum]|uniref:hypothetical protein n=1 Tax=Paraburkholderia fungorum TaxID=134537 RepID=UPI000488E8BE|nr:hypothetical protein [Paraburkholderia fungorum]PNE59834.1 hypothetical protein A8H39_01415 [Paraburkholderia fungorum]